MKVGTKSLLFGVHQFLWHPITVLLAWHRLFGRPDWKTVVCIIIHDWGYWGSPNMDGPEGVRHPEFAADLAANLFDTQYGLLCLYHSRHYAKQWGQEPSKLCWADKLSILYEPWWLYLPRAWLSGELFEYRKVAADYFPMEKTHREWFAWVKDKLVTLGKEMKGDAVPYMGHDGKEKPNEQSESARPAGYWRSNNPKELQAFINETEGRAKMNYAALRGAKKLLNRINARGQMTMDSVRKGT